MKQIDRNTVIENVIPALPKIRKEGRPYEYALSDKILPGYSVWPVFPLHIDGQTYIPLCKPKPGHKWKIEPTTLMAIPATEEVAKILSDAAMCGAGSLQEAEIALKDCSSRDEKEIKLALPYLRRLSE